MASLLIYGAQGYTGRLVASAAKRTLDVTVAARRVPPGEVDACLRLELGDAGALRQALRSHAAVLNCAGPFRHTWRPLVEACLDTGTHYLDLSGEWGVFEAICALDRPARDRGVMLLPGVGFDVVASDCLAAHVAARLPAARRLELGISGLELSSRGTARTILEQVGEPVRVRRGGRIVSDPRLLEASFDFGAGPRSCYAVSWGDVSTAFHTTGIPDVAVYFEATPSVMGLAFANRAIGWALRTAPGRRLLSLQLELLPPGPPPELRAGRRAVLVARVDDGERRRAEARLVTPEAYTFSVATAVSIAERVLAGELRPGFQTPAGLFGADLPLALDGVERKDLL